MYFSILLCHASMYIWKGSSDMCFSYTVTVLSMASTPLKWITLRIILSLKNVSRSKIKWIKNFLQYADVLLGQELLDPEIVGIKWIFVVKLPQFPSFLVHWAKHMPRDLFSNLTIDRLVQWQEPAEDDPPHIDILIRSLWLRLLILDFFAFFEIGGISDFHWLFWGLVDINLSLYLFKAFQSWNHI